MKRMELLQKIGLKGRVELDVPMRELTTMRVGGPADCVVFAACTEDVERAAVFCADRGLPLMVMGRGSNLVVRDGGIRGVVVVLGKDFSAVTVCESEVVAQAGATLGALARCAREASLTGLEFAEGIPGSVGGGVYMNAGAYGGEMSQVLRRVRVFTREGEVETLTAENMEMSYRHTKLMESGAVVLEAAFALQKGEPGAIAAAMEDFSKRRRDKQPLQYASAGSFFKRPAGYFAGKLIQDAGLMGASVGDAQISEKHAGFLINRGNASARDVLELMELVQRTVWEKFGVRLEPEVRIIGEEIRG